MEQKQLFGLALGLSNPWFIDRIEFSAEQKRLDIDIDFKPGSRFSLPNSTDQHPVHDTTQKTWRHLNFFQHECYLHCRTPRVKTSSGHVLLVDPPWAGKSSGFTLLFEALLMQLLAVMPVLQVSRLTQVSDDKLWRMLEAYVETARHMADYSHVNAVGVDETSRRKGHDYITLFVDLEERKTLFIADGKDSATFPSFLLDFWSHKGKTENIERLSMDMSPAFIAGAREYIPDAQVTFDRFHIMKMVNKAVDETRREEVTSQPILKNTRYILLKNRNNLTDHQLQLREMLDMEGRRLKSHRALVLREYLQTAYNQPTFLEFTGVLYDWFWKASHSRIGPLMKVAKTIRKHWDGVVQWFENNDNNGILEGLNSLVQAAKSKARGYRTAKNLKIIAYLITAKLDFSKVNPAIVT